MIDRTIDLLHQQAVVLLDELRDFDSEFLTQTIEERSSLMAMPYQRERLRITTRLFEAMSWILVQRGYEAGEISREDAFGGEFFPGNILVCFGSAKSGHIPERLKDLNVRSLAFYLEVAQTAIEVV